MLASWDPHTRPIITEYAGRIKFENVEEGVTVAKQIDEVTGLSTLVVIDPKRRGVAQAKGLRPSVKLIDDKGKEVKIPGTELPVNITFQIHSIITVKDGQQVQRRRGAGAYPAGDLEDPRHHRRSAARGGAVRGALAEGCRHAGGDHRHGVVR